MSENSEEGELEGMKVKGQSATTAARCGAVQPFDEGEISRRENMKQERMSSEKPILGVTPIPGGRPPKWSDVDREQWERKRDLDIRREAQEAVRRCSSEAQGGSPGENQEVADPIEQQDNVGRRRSFITDSDASIQKWRQNQQAGQVDQLNLCPALNEPRGRGRGRVNPQAQKAATEAMRDLNGEMQRERTEEQARQALAEKTQKEWIDSQQKDLQRQREGLRQQQEELQAQERKAAQRQWEMAESLKKRRTEEMQENQNWKQEKLKADNWRAAEKLHEEENRLEELRNEVARQINTMKPPHSEEKRRKVRKDTWEGDRQRGQKTELRRPRSDSDQSLNPSDSEEDGEFFTPHVEIHAGRRGRGSEDDRVSCSTARIVKRKKAMILDRYEGGDWEMYMIHFENVSQHNGWDNQEKLAYLKSAMKGATLQLLRGKREWTFDSLCREMANQYGTSGNTRQYENDLRVRRRGIKEPLEDYDRAMHVLLMKAYPRHRGTLKESLGMDAYINGLGDRELSLKVRNYNPANMQEAHDRARMLESNQLLVDRSDIGRGNRREDRRGDLRQDMMARSAAEGGKIHWDDRGEEESEEEGYYNRRVTNRKEEGGYE